MNKKLAHEGREAWELMIESMNNGEWFSMMFWNAKWHEINTQLRK